MVGFKILSGPFLWWRADRRTTTPTAVGSAPSKREFAAGLFTTDRLGLHVENAFPWQVLAGLLGPPWKTVRRRARSFLHRSIRVTRNVLDTLLERIGTAGPRSGRPSTVALAVVALAAVLRLYRLGDESVWLDEAFTWVFVAEKYTTVELLTTLPTEDVHPPLYYLLMDGWVGIAGVTETAMRLPSALFGIAAVGLTYVVGAKVFDEWTGVIGAAIVTVSSFHLYYSQEARMYAMLAALTLASYYFFVDLSQGDEVSRWTILGYTVTSVLLVYTHVYGIFVVLAQNAYLVPRLLMADREWPAIGEIRPGPVSVRRWVGLQSAIAFLSAPWLLVLLTRLPTISHGGCVSIAWIPDPCVKIVSRTLHRYFFYCGTAEFYGVPMGSGPLRGVIYPAVVLLSLGLAVVGLGHVTNTGHYARPDGRTIMVVLWFLTPLLVPYALSELVTPILITRYTISASLPLFLLVGKGVRSLRPLVPATGRAVLVVLLVVGLAAPIPTYYEADQKRQWRTAVETVETTADDEALVLVSDTHVLAPYRYYARDSDRTVKSIDDTASIGAVRAAVNDRTDVWVVLSRAKRDVLTERLESLDYVPVEEYQYRGIRVYHFVRDA